MSVVPWAATLIGCSGSATTVDLNSESLPVVTSDDMVAPRAACNGVLLRASERHLENLQRVAKGYLCVPGAGEPPAPLWVDDGGGQIADIGELLAEDVRAFHEIHHAIDEDLRTRIDEIGEAELVDITVWFAIDESDVPGQDETSHSAALGRESNRRLAQRMRVGANKLFADIHAILAKYPALPRATSLFRMDPNVELGAPRVDMRVPRAVIEKIGDLEQVTSIGGTSEGYAPIGSEAYFWTDAEHVLDDGLWDGDAVKVAILEWGFPNSFVNIGGAVAPSPSDPLEACTDFFGLQRKCHCALSLVGDHPRRVAGVVNSTTTPGGTSFGGMADRASLLFANFEPGHTNHPCVRPGQPHSEASAVSWALSQGAHVINYSYRDQWADSPIQDGSDKYFDYIASHPPYPLIVTGTGNANCNNRSANRLYNGIVVGGSNHAGGPGDRGAEDMYCDVSVPGGLEGTQAKNYVSGPGSSASGWELPHVVAPAMNVATAGVWDAQEWVGGTSAAAPQVSGIAASIFEANGAIRSRPQAVLAGFLVAANENVDEDRGGVWPLNLGDTVDDLDGAGLVNAWLTGIVLGPAAKMNGGNTTAPAGHDYGWISATTTPAFAYYSEAWNAKAAPGATLRVASAFLAQDSCSSPPSWTNCNSNFFPGYYLVVFDGSAIVAVATHGWQNYLFTSVKNTTGANKTYVVRLYMSTWFGMSGAEFGVAWTSH